MNDNWENSIILPATKRDFTVLPSPIHFASQKHSIDISKIGINSGIDAYLKNDFYPLPLTEDREGYYGDVHYDYWLSGIEDYNKIINAALENNVNVNTETKILDFGCASGRVLRHFANQSNTESWGCDLNENHVIWCNKYLSKNTRVFQCTSLPHLQIEDSFFNIVFCLSVFSHIDTFETSWLCEMRRILNHNGILYVTIHDESAWENMPREWGVGLALINHPDFQGKWLKEGFPGEKFVSRWAAGKSYSANVFYKIEYIKKTWSKFFNIVKIIPMGHNYQTVLILRK